MKNSELLERVIELAVREQNEAELEYCSVAFYYIAIHKIVENPDIVGAGTFNEDELAELRRLVKSTNTVPLNDIEQKINNGSLDSDDEGKARDLKRWLSFGGKSAVDVWKKIVENFQAEGAIESGHVEEQEEITGQEGVEQDNRKKSAELKILKSAEQGGIDAIVSTTSRLREELLKVVIGQDYAVNKFVDSFFRGELLAETDDNRRGLRALYTFLGRPGVGKTLLAQTAAKAIGRPCLKVDMSCGNVEMLSDIPKCFHGKTPKSFYEFIDAEPKGIVIFDELEKANVQTILKFLTVIDAGEAGGTDFRNAIFIFTTNAGKNLYSMSEYGRLSSIPDLIVKDALEKDIDPITNKPFFPPEIVSRLAAGTMIVFDNLPASDLIKMSAKELDRNVKNTEKRYGVSFEKDEMLPATVLYSIGGTIDGRNAVARTKNFFTKEIYELLRLISAKNGLDAVNTLENIKITVDFTNAPLEVKRLYNDNENTEIVVLANEDVKKRIESANYDCTVKCVTSAEEYTEILDKDDITVAIIDYRLATVSNDTMLNAEDIVSAGRDMFEKTVKESPDTVVFILNPDDEQYNVEEKATLLNNGAADIVEFGDNIKAFMADVCIKACQQNAVDSLKIRHKVLSFNEEQTISDDNKKAEITLYNLKLADAIEAEDRKAIMSEDECPNVTWDDIVVSNKIKEDIEYYVEYLKKPKEFIARARKAPKGILFYGPPGTGKTSIAKIVAALSGVRFIATAGANFQSKWAGETTENVRAVFAQARKNAPAILFIDEIDAIGAKRGDAGNGSSGAVKDQNAVVTALLNEMDGFKSSSKRPVFVIAATNNRNQLDPALLRRFDKHVLLDVPDKEGRVKLFNIFRKKYPDMLSITDEFVENLAVRSIGLSPAKIESAVMAAIEDAVRAGTSVTNEIMDEAFEETIFGEEKKWDQTHLLCTARHEAGHAFIKYYYEKKVSEYLTIVARGDHLGYCLNGDDEDKSSYTKAELLHMICRILGGRAAEIVFYGREDGLSTGLSDDLNKATRIARQMVCEYGMSENIGLIAIGDKGSQEVNGRVEKEIRDILEAQLETAITLIDENKDTVGMLADELYKKQHMTGDEIKEILKK